MALALPAYAAECPGLPPPYQGPIFDADVQAWAPNLTGLLDAVPQTGVRRIALYANTHEDNSRAGGEANADAVLAAARAHPDLIVLGAPKIGFIHGGDLPRGYVAATLAGVDDGTYRLIGEILYTHADKGDNRPQPGGVVYVDPLAPETARLLAGLKSHDVPLLTHWEAWNWDHDLPRFDQLYRAWPAQRFVLPSLAYGSPDKAEQVLSANPNLWATISHLVDDHYTFVDPAKQAALGPGMFDACGVLLPAWRAVLIRHADHLMYASDEHNSRHMGWDRYPGMIARYRRIAGQLPPKVAWQISWGTADALYDAR